MERKKNGLKGKYNPAYKHGMHGSPEYVCWSAMVNRCENVNTPNYKHYGGRGIIVCKEWRDDFMAFYSDMGKRPSLKHSLERIDNNGNYEPDNVRWATSTDQARNRRVRSTSVSGYTGVDFWKMKNRWRARITVNGITEFLGYYDTKEQAASSYKQAKEELWKDKKDNMEYEKSSFFKRRFKVLG